MNNMYVGFTLNNQNYLVAASNIVSILDSNNITFTNVAGISNPSIVGMFYHFEDVITAVNTDTLLGLESHTEKRFIYVLGNGYGLLVDSNGEVKEIDKSSIEPLPIENKFIKSVVNDTEHDKLYLIVEVDQIDFS